MEQPGARGWSLKSLRAWIRSKSPTRISSRKVAGSTCVARPRTSITGKQHVPLFVQFETGWIPVVELQDIQRWNHFPLPAPVNVLSSSCALPHWTFAWCSKASGEWRKACHSWPSVSRYPHKLVHLAFRENIRETSTTSSLKFNSLHWRYHLVFSWLCKALPDTCACDSTLY